MYVAVVNVTYDINVIFAIYNSPQLKNCIWNFTIAKVHAKVDKYYSAQKSSQKLSFAFVAYKIYPRVDAILRFF